MQRKFWYIVGSLVLLLAGGGWWFFFNIGERGKPVVEIGADAAVIGLRKELTVTFSDSGRGLAHTEIIITQDNQPRALSTIDYPETGVGRKAVSVTIDAAALKLHDGPAILTLTAVDHALWKNRITVTHPVTNHINPGGTCVVAYRLSEAALLTGVQVGDLFYPAYPATLAGKPGYAAYFALPLEATSGVPQIRILARDQAGNETASGIPALIQKRKFRSDKMVLTESFLGQKNPVRLPEIGTPATLAGYLSPDEERRPDGPLRRPPNLFLW
jgi:hypothetical protein